MENNEFNNTNDLELESKSIKEEKPLTNEWHYLEFRDNKYDESFIEWKYFNFQQKDIAGYILYFIIDPERKTKIGGARVLARIFNKRSFIGSIREIPVNKVEFDALSVGVSMDESRIIEKNQHNYKISGSLDNISWDLDYKQLAPSIDGFKNENPGIMRWEKVDWLVKMPRAEVKGTIKTADEQIQIDAIGYSDSNWGKFLPFFSKYEWGQFSDEKISFVFGTMYKFLRAEKSFFYFIVDNKIVWLEKPELTVNHKKWIPSDDHKGIKVPFESEFIMQDKQYIIRFTSKLINHDLLGLKISNLLPKSVVSEQIVEYAGTIEKNGNIIHRFDGFGFKEWSTKTWKSLPIVF